MENEEKKAFGDETSSDSEVPAAEKEVAVSVESASAEPPSNYEKEMGIEAAEIAKQLAAQTGMSVEVQVHRPTDVPKPTLGSLRERAKKLAETFLHCIEQLTPDRREARSRCVTRGMLEYIHRGTGEGLRKHAMTGGERNRVRAQLSDSELAELMSCGCQDNAAVATGLGIWAGAMLVRSGFSIEEIMECACDPIFVFNVIGLRANPLTISKLALEVLADVPKAELEDRAKTVS